MNTFPTLDELLDYGEDYKIPDLLSNDYFIVDNKRKQQNNQGKESNEQDNSDNGLDEGGTEELEDDSKKESTNNIPKESSEQDTSDNEPNESSTDELEDSKEEATNDTPKESNEQDNLDNVSDEGSTDELEDFKEEATNDKESNEQDNLDNVSDEGSIEELEDDSKKESTNNISKESNEQDTSDNGLDEGSTGELEDSKEGATNDTLEESNEQDNLDNASDENDFDDLLNNYDEDCKSEFDKQENEMHKNASNKINDITPLTIYKVLKKLVSLSYENYQKGTYKYNKKEIIKHYLTEQKFKILDDLQSLVFKPDVYVFDLSPSNDNSLEMYVNAISSVAIKGSIIYLTFNNEILRKLIVKKQYSKSIDVREIVNSENDKYKNLECTVYNEYQSLYEELKDIKDRKIYIFSDLDISNDMVKLSKKNKSIVWFSTENNVLFHSFFKREVPKDYEGLYVDTKDITDIEKYVKEKNKSKYRRRRI